MPTIQCYYRTGRTGSPLHLAIHDQPHRALEFDSDTFLEMAEQVTIELPIHETTINSFDDMGNTPLHTAIIVGYNTGQYITMYAVLRTLLNGGADKLIKNTDQQTPMELIKSIISYETDNYTVMNDVLNHLFAFKLGDKVKVLVDSSCYSIVADYDEFPVGTIGYIVYIRQRYKNSPNYYCQYKISLENKICTSNDLRHLYLSNQIE